MRRLVTVVVMIGALAVVTTGTAAASHKGEPQGPHKKQWLCVVDLFTWHCVPPGVLANLGGPSGPSLNWECDDPEDPLCGPDNWGAVTFGPPEGTHFVGTENLIRADLVPQGGLPCPRGTSGFVELPFGPEES